MNAYNAVMAGYQNGQQRRLGRLAGESYTAPAEQRNSLLGQMAQISPQAAQAQQGQFDQQEDRTAQQLRGYVQYVNSARKQNNPAAVNAALRAGSGLIERLTGRPGPTEWTPDMDSGWAELEARVAMSPAGAGGAGVQSTYVDGEGNRVAIMRDGSTQVLGANDTGATQQTISINGPDGRPAQYTFDRRTGNYVPAGAGMGSQQAAPQVSRFTAPDGMQVDIGTDIDPAMRENIMQFERAQGAVPDGTQVQMPERQVAQFSPGGQVAQAPQGGSQFVGQSPAEKAAAETAARQQAELAYLPARQQIETQGAIDRTIGTERAKGQIEREGGRNKARLSLDQATARLSRVDELVGSILPRINIGTAGWAGNALSNIPGTAAADLRKDIGTLQAIAGFDELNAMRASSPTGGALGNVTERELAFLQSVVRNIENSQSPQQLERNLRSFQQELRGSWQRVNDAYQQDYGQGGGPQGGQPAVQRARNPQTGEVLELRDGQWVPAR